VPFAAARAASLCSLIQFIVCSYVFFFIFSTNFLICSLVTRRDDSHHGRNSTRCGNCDHNNDRDRDNNSTRRDNSDRGDRNHDTAQPDDSARDTMRGATPRVHSCALEIGAHKYLKNDIKTTAVLSDALGVQEPEFQRGGDKAE
jgi:hypothetical protein